MRAIVVTRKGGPEVLEVTKRPDPAPGPGEVLIDVAASGVNFIDVYFRTGLYPVERPYVPGVEGAGTVASVGEGVTGLAPGDRVAWAQVQGSYAERAVVPADQIIPLQDGVSFEDGAAALLQGMTAHYLTHSTYAIQPGDTVLVHAAAGGVGLLLTQLSKHLGARVIATVSTSEKGKLAQDAGADEVLVGYDGFSDKVRALTSGKGVAAVYDGIGAPTFEGSLASLRQRGTLALYGAAGGPVPPFDPQALNRAGSLFLTRPSLAHHLATREELTTRAGDIYGWVASGDLRLHIGNRYPLDEVPTAHEDLEARRSTGKLLIIP
ncbi:quinone oxidoreductase family protein [Spirillospora sp. CA-294931]|uniref:quinone oxidoreductase family protein n=1 Tax=Spirillospora sp. CA-294931 TaxID=3240042 RepID=UPI003D8BE06C